jgi:hypothetical protein
MVDNNVSKDILEQLQNLEAATAVYFVQIWETFRKSELLHSFRFETGNYMP